MPAHTHVADISTLAVAPQASTAAGTTNTPDASLVPAVPPSIGSGPNAVQVKNYAAKDGTTTLFPTAVSGNVVIGPAGGSQPFSIQNPYLAMTWLIATDGVFPSRN
jgi:microcystin-dependent protein